MEPGGVARSAAPRLFLSGRLPCRRLFLRRPLLSFLGPCDSLGRGLGRLGGSLLRLSLLRGLRLGRWLGRLWGLFRRRLRSLDLLDGRRNFYPRCGLFDLVGHFVLEVFSALTRFLLSFFAIIGGEFVSVVLELIARVSISVKHHEFLPLL